MLIRLSQIVFYLLTISTNFSMEMTIANSNTCFHTGKTFNCSGLGLLTLPDSEHIPLHIETLDVSFNNIENISFLKYHKLSQSLSALNLSHNKISSIYRCGFKNLTDIVFLDLSFNSISGRSLKDMDLSDLRKLHHLKLRNNPLRVIHSDTFNFIEHPTLTHLDLSNCEIKELEKEAIDIRSLEYLDLSWNHLTVFKELSFNMMPCLKTLDLSHNRITVLNEIPYMPELVTLIADSNFIDTIDIKEQIEDYADNLQELYLRCEDPSSLKNKNLLELTPEDLKCGSSKSRIVFSVLISVVGVLVLIFVIVCVVRQWRRRKREGRAVRADTGDKYIAVYTHKQDELESEDRAPLKIYTVPVETL